MRDAQLRVCRATRSDYRRYNKRNSAHVAFYVSFRLYKITFTVRQWALTHLPKVTITADACVLDLAACVMFARGEKRIVHISR